MIHRTIAGWRLRHITARTAYLVKEDAIYRQLFGQDGYVLVRADQSVTRDELLDKAEEQAEAADAKVGLMLADRLLPADFKIKERAKKYEEGSLLVSTGGATVLSLHEYRAMQARLARAFATPEDPQVRLYRP